MRYTLRLVFFNKGLEADFLTQPGDALTVGFSGSDIVLSRRFFDLLRQNVFNHESHLAADGTVKNEAGEIDYLSTIFYLTNSLQEYYHPNTDQHGRFRYSESIQYKLGNVKENVVQLLIDALFSKHPKLLNLPTTKRASKIFLTHDLDSFYGYKGEDGLYALKNMKLDKVLQIMWSILWWKPEWMNMDQIMKLEDEYSYRSTFYWLLKKDKLNSDYDFPSAKVQKQFKLIEEQGWENGLHKSIGDSIFKEEIGIFGSQPEGNRYHFLKYQIPTGYATLEANGIKLDTTLGYTESMGFRNSYGLPFMPFNLKEKRVFNLVEVPQLVMDRTFFRDRLPVTEIKREIISLFENNKSNCVFTINWHNNFFTGLKYNGYLPLYRDLLIYFKENGVQHTTQKDILNEYYQPALFAN